MNTKGPMYARGLAQEIAEASGVAEKIKTMGWRPVSVRPAAAGDVVWSDTKGPELVPGGGWTVGLVSLILEKLPPPPPETYLPTTGTASGLLAVPVETVNAITKAGYRLDRIGFVAEGDVIWHQGFAIKAGPYAAGTLALILVVREDLINKLLKEAAPENAAPEPKPGPGQYAAVRGALYVEPTSSPGAVLVGFTPEHYLYLTQAEAREVVRALAGFAGVVTTGQNYDPLYLLACRVPIGLGQIVDEIIAGPTQDGPKIAEGYDHLMKAGRRAVVYALQQVSIPPGGRPQLSTANPWMGVKATGKALRHLVAAGDLMDSCSTIGNDAWKRAKADLGQELGVNL